jgi:hypothetical protein
LIDTLHMAKTQKQRRDGEIRSERALRRIPPARTVTHAKADTPPNGLTSDVAVTHTHTHTHARARPHREPTHRHTPASALRSLLRHGPQCPA